MHIGIAGIGNMGSTIGARLMERWPTPEPALQKPPRN